MTNIQCRVCGAQTDALLCQRCLRELRQSIAELPADYDDLGHVSARAARGPLGLGDPSRSCERASKDDAWEAPGSHTPEALGDAPWMFAPAAADQRWVIVNTLTTWIRHLAESRGLRTPSLTHRVTRGLYAHRNRIHWHVETIVSTTVAPLSNWLLAHLDAVRFDEAAEQIHEEFTGLHVENNRWILGRSGMEVFAGRCDASQLSFTLGPDATLVAVAATCDAALYGHDNEDDLRCQACGTRYSLRARLEEMQQRQINEQLAPAHTIANALTTIDEPLAPSLLRKWIERDARRSPAPEGPACAMCRHETCAVIRRPPILAQGFDDDGKPLYRFGDVRARLGFVQAQRGAKLSA